MNGINKQKFLAELSRLLTFMYEEDRQEALAMYSSMFDEAEDENKLIQLLMSPTRQAVVVARAYDAKDRKLQVKSQSREDSGRADGETPDFVLAIDKIRSEAEEKEILRARVSDDQFSFFDEPEEEAPEIPAEEPAAVPFVGEAVSDSFDVFTDNDVPELVEPDVDEIIGEVSDFEEPAAEEVPAEAEEEPAEEPAETEGPAGEEESPAEPAEEEGQSAEEEPAPSEEDAAEEEPAEAEEEPAAEAPAEEQPAWEEPVPNVPASVPAQAEEKAFDYTRDIPDEDGYFEPQRKPMVGWLILFVIFAIPVGFVACVACVALALLFLALAAAVAAAGVFAIRALFSGFAVFADILLVGGAAIGALALGLLFLWTAIWFLFGAIPGVVRGLIELGRSWCCKEVAE